MSDTSQSRMDRDKTALLAIESLEARIEELEQARSEPIAIVGLSCRFPGAADIESYWRLLRDGGDAIREVPSDRWDIETWYDPDPDTAGKMYSRHGGFLDHIDQF